MLARTEQPGDPDEFRRRGEGGPALFFVIVITVAGIAFAMTLLEPSPPAADEIAILAGL